MRDKNGRFVKGHKLGIGNQNAKGKKYSRPGSQRLERNHNWKGGRRKNHEYVEIKVYGHPNANNKGYILEHRLVMEKVLGRYLEKGEIVHHRNGIKDDNRPENLEVVVYFKHFGEVRCPHCLKEFKVK